MSRPAAQYDKRNVDPAMVIACTRQEGSVSIFNLETETCSNTIKNAMDPKSRSRQHDFETLDSVPCANFRSVTAIPRTCHTREAEGGVLKKLHLPV